MTKSEKILNNTHLNQDIFINYEEIYYENIKLF